MNDASEPAILPAADDEGDVAFHEPSASGAIKRRWVAGAAALGVLGIAAWAVHAWLDSRPPTTVIAYVLVVDKQSAALAPSLFSNLGGGTFWLPEDGSTTGAWDACSGSGVFADYTPGAPVEFIEGERKSPAGSASPVPVISASLRNVNGADLSRLENASKDWASYLEGIDGNGTSYLSVTSASDKRSTLESLATEGHACLLAASMPYDDVDFLTVSLPQGLGSGWAMVDTERRDGVYGIIITGNFGDS